MPAAHFAVLHPHRRMALVFPATLPGMADLLPLIRAEKAEVEAVLGVEVDIVEHDPGAGPRWLVAVDPDAPHNALAFDRTSFWIENHSIPVDVETDVFTLDGAHPALEGARRWQAL